MPFRKKIRSLISRCQFSQSRCDAKIAGFSREIQELMSSKESLQVQIEGLRKLLKTQRVDDEVLNREQLNVILRKQSVLRRKIYECNALISQIIEQCKELEEKRIEQQKKRQYWLRKEDNYNRWLSKQKQQIYLFNLRQDEVEQEERIQWNL